MTTTVAPTGAGVATMSASIRTRLFLAFGAIGGMALVAVAIAVWAFGRVEIAVDTITSSKMPTVEHALNVARLATAVTASAPVLANAKDTATRQETLAQVARTAQGMDALIAKLQAARVDTSRLAPLAAEMRGRVADIDRLTVARLALEQRHVEMLEALHRAHDRVVQRIAPLVDESQFNLELGLADGQAETDLATLQAKLGELATKDFVLFEALTRLNTVANAVVAVLAEAAEAPNAARIVPLRERITAVLARLQKAQAAADKIKPDPARNAALDELTGFAGGQRDILARRAEELALYDRAGAALSAARVTASRLTQEAENLVTEARRGTDDAMAEKDATLATAVNAMLVVGVVALVAALLIGWLYVARGLAARLSALVSAMRDIAAGDLERKVPTGGSDEIGVMASALEKFRDAEREARDAKSRHEAERQAMAVQRRREMAELANTFESRVQGVVQEIASAATQLQASAQGLGGQAMRTSEQAAAVAESAQQATGNVQSVASASEQMSGSVAEIGRQATRSASMSGEAVKQAESTNEAVQSLAATADKIGEVVKLINGIAGQTNLLALNATIEAARAGEAGKGFAVVAAEVKNLAMQTARATEEISTQIAGIQGATGTAAGAIQNIAHTINDLSAIASSIASAVEEQTMSTREIARNVQEAARSTTGVSSSIDAVSRVAEETGAASKTVLDAARALGGAAENLKREMDSFVLRVRSA